MSQAFKDTYTVKTTTVEHEVRHVRAVGAEEALGSLDTKAGSAFSKLGRVEVEVDDSVQPGLENEIGGAFYLPLKKTPAETYRNLVEALNDMKDTDFSVNPSDLAAHGFLYSDDKYMLARAKIVKLDSEKNQGDFLELNKLEGDGFVFADVWKRRVFEAMKESIGDDDSVQPDLEEESVDYKFLDFSADEESSMLLMEKLLGHLKPREGVKYDHKKIFESVSTLGHNVAEEASSNFEFVNQFQDHIVPAVLEVMRHEETSFLPTVYFGSKLLTAFLKPEVLEKEFKTWANFEMLAEALEMHCLKESAVSEEVGAPEKQVTRSRESLAILVNALCVMGPMCEDELEPAKRAKLVKIFEAVPEDDTKKTLLALL